MNWDTSQQNALIRAIDPAMKRLIVAGGAGTGKTTLISEIVRSSLGRKCTVLATTGKAAARIREIAGIEASTIHRELGYDGLKFNKPGPFKETVIIDESSMIDSLLMAKILEYKPPRLILVGDPAQLPPVGPGQPFHDLAAMRQESVCTLQVCHRAQGAVHLAASAIREGHSIEKQIVSGGEVWTMKQTGEAEATTAQIVKWVKAGFYDPTKDFILSPRYGDADNDGGIDALNVAVKAIVNPSTDKFAPGDRVLCCKNFSKDDLWNGDIGTLTGIDLDGNWFLRLDRDSLERAVTREQRREFRHAYALSVHKAQGSQARRVIFVCLRRHWYQLNRSLVYTAITRAQEGCVVCGELDAFWHGVNTLLPRSTVMQYLGGFRS